MNSQTPELFPSEKTPSSPPVLPDPFFVLDVPGRLPSWNEILGMEHWARYQLKEEIQVAFLSALRASGGGYSMRTTSVKNSMLTAADTLASYRKILRERRRLKQLSKKLSPEARSSLESKSSKSKPPF